MRGIWSMPMHGYINHPAKCHNLRERKPDCGLIACARNSEEYGLYGFDVHSDGSGLRHLNAGIRENESNNALDSNGSVWSFPPKQSLYSCILMNGKEVFHFVVRCVPQSIENALEKAGLPASSID
ncbi:3-oxoacyl-[acyl-carrier-protein] synthase 3 A, chloroplastic [Trifolium repens]|nr:3-oxoacyl-[acyl-carrier-protein] synthase 3 A, chloroplastic [Trifolium repens]